MALDASRNRKGAVALRNRNLDPWKKSPSAIMDDRMRAAPGILPRHAEHFLIIGMLVLALGSPRLLGKDKDPCDDSQLPREARDLLSSQYSSWRIHRLADLEPVFQTMWTRTHPKACPGIAVGHFFARSASAYAVLLVPTGQGKKGFRLLVIAPDKDSQRLRVAPLEKDDQYEPKDLVISTGLPGQYFNYDDESNFKTTSDGILVEFIERSSILFFWKSGKLNKVKLSE